MKQPISSDKAPKAMGAYTPAIKVGDFIFVSGQGPLDPATNKVIEAGIEEQTARTLENIKAILEAAGASMADVVKVAAHLEHISDFQAFNKVYATYFPDPKPARTTVQSGLLNILVEIDAIAYVGEK
ncbi:MAG: deaminase [Armatimonadetes bacterium]|nr:deaminase [Armatimonadota bacterium]